MSERDDRYARNDLPSTTAEFRAAPDISASTAEFQAFAAGEDARSGQPRKGLAAWPEQPRDAAASPAPAANRNTALIIGVVVAVAVIVTILVFVL